MQNTRWPTKSGGKTIFCEKTPIEYVGTLKVKNFVDKFLACFVSKINTFYAEIQDDPQKWWEKDFGKKTSVDCRSTVDQKFRQNRSRSLHFQDKHIFTFYEEIQDGHQKWQEKDFSENSPVNYADIPV